MSPETQTSPEAANKIDPVFLEKPVPGAPGAADIGVRRITVIPKQTRVVCVAGGLEGW